MTTLKGFATAHQHQWRSLSAHPCYALRSTAWNRPNQPANKLSQHQHLNTLNSNVICLRIIVILNTQTAHHNDHHSWVSVFCPNQHISVWGLHCRAVWMLTTAGGEYLGREGRGNVANDSEGFDWKQCLLPRCYLLLFYRVDSNRILRFHFYGSWI